MIQLAEIDRAWRRVQLFDAELLDEIIHGEEFGMIVVAPADQGHPIDDGFGQVALLFHVGDEDRLAALEQFGRVAFAHFALAAGFQENGGMDPNGLLPAESLVEMAVQRESGQPLRGAEDVRDFHQVIVDHNGKVIDGQAVGFDQDIVVQ